MNHGEGHRAWPTQISREATRGNPALLDRCHRLASHPGEGLNFSFQGERLSRVSAVLPGVPVALGSPATGPVHTADLKTPAPPALGTGARSFSIWHDIATPGAYARAWG